MTVGSKDTMATSGNAEQQFMDIGSHRDGCSLAGLCQLMSEMWVRYDSGNER